jgi:hypothetical protein
VLPSLQAIQRAFHPAAATPEMALTINHQLFTLNFLESISLSLGLGITVSTMGAGGEEKPCIALWNLIKYPCKVNTITFLELMQRFCLNTQ